MPTLRELRERRFLSQKDLARQSGVAASTINRLELGRQTARFITIRKLAKALGVEPGEIGLR
jgi:transcriptional regulator with XRE-family HTH domain